MVVRGLASHRRGLGSIPESGITCRLNFLLVLGPSCRYSEVFIRVLSPQKRKKVKPLYKNVSMQVEFSVMLQRFG